MYSQEYINPLVLYERYKAKTIALGIYNRCIVYIDTTNRVAYNTLGQAVLQFRH